MANSKRMFVVGDTVKFVQPDPVRPDDLRYIGIVGKITHDEPEWRLRYVINDDLVACADEIELVETAS